jgi:hypothetical protein
MDEAFKSQSQRHYLDDLHLRDYTFIVELRSVIQSISDQKIVVANVFFDEILKKYNDVDSHSILRAMEILAEWVSEWKFRFS